MLLVTDMVYRYQDYSKQFTSHVLNIMVIMFLQRITEPVLPTLHQLRSSLPYEKVIIGGMFEPCELSSYVARLLIVL